jgi:predicted RNase H-like nuclease
MSLITSIIGFDSAWTDNPKAPGAVCVIRIDVDGRAQCAEPELASFGRALEIIRLEKARFPHVLIALDQPTIVTNLTGSRPVERVIASYISWIGGGVQPSNRGRAGMFDDAAPIWAFKTALGAIEDPEQARLAREGLFIMEVFPALALPGFFNQFSARLGGPRYNPARRKTFKIEHWQKVTLLLSELGFQSEIDGLADWCRAHAEKAKPSKADQDLLDAIICAAIGYHWLRAPRDQSIMIGDRQTGYIVAPAMAGVHEKLSLAAMKHGVAIDGVYI